MESVKEKLRNSGETQKAKKEGCETWRAVATCWIGPE